MVGQMDGLAKTLLTGDRFLAWKDIHSITPTADLGRFTFEPAMAVQVRVIDSAGQTLEGIPIRRLYVDRDGTRGWSVPHNTDEQGIARFHVIPNSTGAFGVLYHDDQGIHLKETLDYQVAGLEDTGREFLLQLSDEMLAFLLQ